MEEKKAEWISWSMSLVDFVLDSVEGLDCISNFTHHYYFVLFIQIFTFVFLIFLIFSFVFIVIVLVIFSIIKFFFVWYL
jgi:hypothetical protein